MSATTPSPSPTPAAAPSFKIKPFTNDTVNAIITNNVSLDGTAVRFRSTTNNATWVCQGSGKALVTKGPVATPGVASYDPNSVYTIKASGSGYTISPTSQSGNVLWIAGGKTSTADIGIESNTPTKWRVENKTFTCEKLWAWKESSGELTLAVKLSIMYDGKQKRWIRLNETGTGMLVGNVSTATEFFMDLSSAGPAVQALISTAGTSPGVGTTTAPQGGGGTGTPPPGSDGSGGSGSGSGSGSGTPGGGGGGGTPWWVWLLVALGVALFLGGVVFALK